MWFDSSAAVLQMTASDCIRKAHASQPGILSFGVTPAILSRTIALKAVERLLLLHGAEFEVLLQAIMVQSYQGVSAGINDNRWWTEYAIYALMGCYAENFGQYHQNFGHGVYAEDGDTVHHASQIVRWNASHVFREDADSAPFIFFQSMLAVTAGDLAAHVKLYLTS